MSDFERKRDTKYKEKTRSKTKKPPLFKVLLHNDDYTTMDFVVYILKVVFYKENADAEAIMLNVHQRGSGVAGVYTFEIAEAKVDKVTKMARAQDFPLRLSIEEDSP